MRYTTAILYVTFVLGLLIVWWLSYNYNIAIHLSDNNKLPYSGIGFANGRLEFSRTSAIPSMVSLQPHGTQSFYGPIIVQRIHLRQFQVLVAEAGIDIRRHWRSFDEIAAAPGKWAMLGPAEQTSIFMPFSIVVVAVVIPGVCVWGKRWARIWYRKRHDRCVKCGYDLRGRQSEICPECGRPTEGGPRPCTSALVSNSDSASRRPPSQ